MSTTRFPLTLAPDRRHLLDPSGTPFLVNGEAAWSLATALDRDEVIGYLDRRVEQGFNAVIVNVLEALFAPRAPANMFGIAPFSTPGDLTTPVDEYFDHVAWCLEAAAERGVLVLAAPAYLGHEPAGFPGYDGRSEGWLDAMLATGVEGCGRYGRYLGARLAALDNIVWVLCGDHDPADAIEHVRALARGLLEARGDRFALAHPGPNTATLDCFDASDADWLTLNSTYSYEIVHKNLRRDYGAAEMPNILFESTYENEWNSTPQQVRRQAYWAMTSGAIGHCLGVYPVWAFNPGWREALEGPAATDLPAMARLFESLEWWRLAPYAVGDFVDNREFVREGLGEMNGLDLATTALSAQRDLGVVYVPTARRVSLDLPILAGDRVRVETFDAATGARSVVGRVPTAERFELDPPGDEDWVIVLTAEAAR